MVRQRERPASAGGPTSDGRRSADVPADDEQRRWRLSCADGVRAGPATRVGPWTGPGVVGMLTDVRGSRCCDHGVGRRPGRRRPGRRGSGLPAVPRRSAPVVVGCRAPGASAGRCDAGGAATPGPLLSRVTLPGAAARGRSAASGATRLTSSVACWWPRRPGVAVAGSPLIRAGPVSTVRRWLRRVRGVHVSWLRRRGVEHAQTAAADGLSGSWVVTARRFDRVLMTEPTRTKTHGTAGLQRARKSTSSSTPCHVTVLRAG